MSNPIPVVIQGARSVDDVPGLDALSKYAELRFATDRQSLSASLVGAEVVFGWDFRADDLENCWDQAKDLKWIHWGGAGVDAAMFPGLVNSDVTLTNSRGLFDRAMAEWTLGMMIAHAKNTLQLVQSQQQKQWAYGLNHQMLGQNALIVGVGSIGREICRMLKLFGLNVSGVGRSARGNDAEFGHVHAQNELNKLLSDADYVILITPLTAENENMFSAAQFKAMKPSAQFINIGRGPLVNEHDFIAAMNNGEIAGAALDVFRNEPLKQDNPIWDAPNTFISPHVCGDFQEHRTSLAQLFYKNFESYRLGRELSNIVDKDKGFVTNGTT